MNRRSVAGFLKETESRCPSCLRPVPAIVHETEGGVFLSKSCPEHGSFEVRLAEDRRYYYPSKGSCGGGSCCDPIATSSTCIALIEVIDTCNLACPTCYADSPPGREGQHDGLAFDEFQGRLEKVIERKGPLDIVQLSGGEPTLHPEILTLLRWCLEHRDIGYVLLNTNGVRLAQDRTFARELGDLRREKGKFELYLQHDGPQHEGQEELRGQDLRRLKNRALEVAEEQGIPVTLALVVTAQTLPFLGDAVRFGLERRHCRGITFQPFFSSGRRESETLPPPISTGEIVRNLIAQSDGLLTEADFTPLPCGDPNCHTVGYLLRLKDRVAGLGRFVDLASLQGFLSERVDFNLEDLSRCGCESEPLGQILRKVELSPDQPFRLFIKPFMDAMTFDQDRIDRCCTHVVGPDGALDSFCRHYLTRTARTSC